MSPATIPFYTIIHYSASAITKIINCRQIRELCYYYLINNDGEHHMKVRYEATQEEKQKLVYDCLVDGLPFFPAYGLSLDYDSKQAKAAEKTWKARNPGEEMCREDVWAEIVRNGGDLIFIDDENDGEEAGRLNLANIEKNWDTISEHAPTSMKSYIDDNYDAGNTDNIIQCLIFGEVVYG